MEARNYADVGGDERNLARMLNNALQEADACGGYALDAEAAGNERLAGFFRDVQETYTSVAGRAEKMLGDRGEGRFPTGVRRDSVRAGEDPGEVSDR
jgi:phage shock protein A